MIAIHAASGTIRFLSNGRLRWFSGRDNPRQTGTPKPWPLNEIEKVAVLQQRFEFAYAVPAELFVFEIHGVPSSFLPVENIDRSRIRISRYEQEQQDRHRQLDPANDVDFSVIFVTAAIALCTLTPGSTCTIGSTIIRPNICSNPFRGSPPTSGWVVVKTKGGPITHHPALGQKRARVR